MPNLARDSVYFAKMQGSVEFARDLLKTEKDVRIGQPLQAGGNALQIFS